MPAKIDARVAACVRDAETSGCAQEIPVIVTLRSSADVDALRAHGLRVRHVFADIAAVAGRVQTSQVTRLADLLSVERIEYDGEMHALDVD